MGLLPQHRGLRTLLLAGAIAAVLVCGVSAWMLLTGNSFNARVEAIRAAGQPATIADLKPPHISPDEDAAAHLASVEYDIAAFGSENGRFYNTPVGKTYDARKPGDPPTTEQVAAIRAILDRYPKLAAAITKAAACDRYGSRLDFTQSHHQFLTALTSTPLLHNQTIHRYGRWEMEAAIAEGRHAEAVARGIELMRLARLMQNEPGLVGGLKAIAVYDGAAQVTYQALAAGPVPADLHAKLDKELAQRNDMRPFVQTMLSELAIVISGMLEQFGGVRGLAIFNGVPMRMQIIHVLDLYESLLADADKPWFAAAADPQSVIFPPSSGVGTYADLLRPGLMPSYDAANRTVAVARSLRIYNALRRFAAEQGREAASLAELQLPAEVTTDPFSGKPLVLKSSEGGWDVYSVGPDGKDDGGDERKDYGVGPRR